MSRYLLQLLIAFDQLACAFFGGWADETISSYLYRLDRQGKPAGRLLRPVVDAVARSWPFHEDDHCYEAYKSERERAQLPPELRAASPTGLPRGE